jgi:flagellar basal-body rod modification protein FlgD
MTISALGGVNEAAQSQFSDALQTSSLGKEDFLRLLVTQLQNQDPLQPMENTEFVAQLAQFSSLEQLTNVNEQLTGVQLGQISMSNLQAADLVGQEITARGDHFTYDGNGGADLSFELDGDVAGGEVAIYDEFGGLVRTIDLGEQDAGLSSVHWDGRTDSGTLAGSGRYRMEVTAHDAEDNPVNVSTLFTGEVTGIFFDEGLTELEVEGSRVRLGDIVSVGSPSTPPDDGESSDMGEE